ncbi:hypothetical protein ACFLX9_02710 [Chloroflexota bacterium]
MELVSRGIRQVQEKTSTIAHLSITLSLVQTACAMALEGITRASVTEVVRRAMESHGTRLEASTAGQLFSAMGVRTVTSHGRNRLVLDQEELLPLRDRMAADYEKQAQEVEEYLSTFQPLVERVRALEEKRETIIRMMTREHQLKEMLREREGWLYRYRALEKEAAQLRQIVSAVTQLRGEIRSLKSRARGFSSLERRKAKLEEDVAAHEREEAVLSKKEEALASRLDDLKRRAGWLSLAQMEQVLVEAKQELDDLSRQLGEKRSLVQKLFGKGGQP